MINERKRTGFLFNTHYYWCISIIINHHKYKVNNNNNSNLEVMFVTSIKIKNKQLKLYWSL